MESVPVPARTDRAERLVAGAALRGVARHWGAHSHYDIVPPRLRPTVGEEPPPVKLLAKALPN